MLRKIDRSAHNSMTGGVTNRCKRSQEMFIALCENHRLLSSQPFGFKSWLMSKAITCEMAADLKTLTVFSGFLNFAIRLVVNVFNKSTNNTKVLKISSF